MTGGTVTCVVADDHPAVVRVLTRYLEERGAEVVGTARNGRQAIGVIEETKPRVAVLDFDMPGMSGVDVTRETAERSPGTATILYTAYARRNLLGDALSAGARGFVQKEAPLDDLYRAVETVAGGGTYVDPVLSAAIVGAADPRKLPTLTVRQCEVLRLLADGLTNEGIGEQLGITEEAVRYHVRRAMESLEADTRTQAVATAIRQSLIE